MSWALAYFGRSVAADPPSRRFDVPAFVDFTAARYSEYVSLVKG